MQRGANCTSCCGTSGWTRRWRGRLRRTAVCRPSAGSLTVGASRLRGWERGSFRPPHWPRGSSGRAVDPLVQEVWNSVGAARNAVVTRLRESWPAELTGADLDDTARGVIRAAGFGEYFTHRTGHSIDRELQGSGPHLDNFETSDKRALVPGVGFSVEPGIYLPGRFGVRSEINVFLQETGPEVTPAVPQDNLLLM